MAKQALQGSVWLAVSPRSMSATSVNHWGNSGAVQGVEQRARLRGPLCGGGLAGVRVLGVFVRGTERKRSACACAVQEHTETRPAWGWEMLQRFHHGGAMAYAPAEHQ